MADPVSLDPPLKGQCLCGAVTIRLARAKPGVDVFKNVIVWPSHS